MDNELLFALAQALGLGEETERQRVILNPESKGTETYSAIIQTVNGLANMEKDLDKIEKELGKLEEEGWNFDERKEWLESQDGARELFTSYSLGKEITNKLLASLAEDGYEGLQIVDAEDYDGCNCVVCSIRDQLQTKGIID